MVEIRNKEAANVQQFSLKDAEAIRQCLSYLEVEASKIGLDLTAHIIGVAAETVSETIARAQVMKSAPYANGKDSAAPNPLGNSQVFEGRSRQIKFNGITNGIKNGAKG